MVAKSRYKKFICLGVISAFLVNTFGQLPLAKAQDFYLPMPGVMVHLGPKFTPAILKGIVIHPENSLKFDFIIYKGDQVLSLQEKKTEYSKLIKYFLASLAIPDDNQWVNLSPYEKDRIITQDFGKTGMGRDLLAQDYILKQLTASLIYPKDNLGQEFWDRVYAKAYREFGTTHMPFNTFNKVWIIPDDAEVFEKGNMAYVSKNHLKVMLEEDYLSLQKHHITSAALTASNQEKNAPTDLRHKAISNQNVGVSQVLRQLILPELEREVNEGKNFAPLRQVFSGVVLATWYKRKLKESLLGKAYMNQSRLKGVDQDPKNNQIIYQQYLRAFKKGVFNFIQEDLDKYSRQVIPRKYFSGGTLTKYGPHFHIVLPTADRLDNAMKDSLNEEIVTVQNRVIPSPDAAMQTETIGPIRVAKQEASYSDDRKVRTSRLLNDGKHELVALGQVRAKWELEKVVKSRDLTKLGLTWGDGSAIDNDSFAYGEDEHGNKTHTGRPNWIYVLKPKSDSGLDHKARIYAGDSDIRRTFPENVYPKEYKMIEQLRRGKNEEIDEYTRKVEDMRRMGMLLPSEFAEPMAYYKDILLPEIDPKQKGSIGVGDPSFQTIDYVYSMFQETWGEVYQGQHAVRMEDFFLAWHSFKEGLRFLKTESVKQEGMPGVIPDKVTIKFIIDFIDRLNTATDEESSVRGRIDLSSFWAQVDQLIDIFESVKAIAGRLAERRLEAGRGHPPHKTHPDDVNRDGYIDANRLVAKDLVDELSRHSHGTTPKILVVDAQGGVLRKEIQKLSPPRMNVIDIEEDVHDGVDLHNVAVQAQIQTIDPDTGFPVITGRTTAAEHIAFDATFKAQVMVMTHIFNQFRRSLYISNALRAVLNLLDAPNEDLTKAPLLYITFPEGTSLARTEFEQALFRLGFEPLRQAEHLKFVLTEEAKTRLRQRIINEMQEAQETIDPREVDRLLAKAEQSSKKNINYGVYARLRKPTPNTDISNLKMTKKAVSEDEGTTKPPIRGVLNWDYLRNFSRLVSLGEDAKTIDPQASTEIYKRGDVRLLSTEEAFDALVAFRHYQNGILSNSFTSHPRELDMALALLKLWDEDNVPYLMHAEKVFIETFVNHIGISESVLKEIFKSQRESLKSTGPLDFLASLLVPFERALGPAHGGIYSIRQIYHALMDLDQNAAMVTEAERKSVKDQWVSFIAQELMGQGKIPLPEMITEALGPSQRQKRFQLRLFFNITNRSHQVAEQDLDQQLEKFIVEAVTQTMKDKIDSLVLTMLAMGEATTLEHVAEKLFEIFPYFQTWHHQLTESVPQQTKAASLRKWVETFNIDDISRWGISDWLHTQEDISQAVVQVKEDGTGLVPDIYNVATALYNRNKEFAAWVNSRQADMMASVNPEHYQWFSIHDPQINSPEKISQRAARGLLLLAWIKHHEKEMTDQHIFLRFGIYVPDSDTLKLSTQSGGKLNSQNGVFELSLTEAAGILEGLTDDQILQLRRKGQPLFTSQDEVQEARRTVAKLRFLRDTMEIVHTVNKEGIDILNKIIGAFGGIDFDSLPPEERLTVNFGFEIMINFFKGRGAAISTIENVNGFGLLLNQIRTGRVGPSQRDPFAIRSQQNRRLARVGVLIAADGYIHSMFSFQAANKIQERKTRKALLADLKSKDRVCQIIYPLLEASTLENLARALTNSGDPVSTEELRAWFSSQGVKPIEWGIRDYQEAETKGWEKIEWPAMERHLKEAVAFINQNGHGLMPDVDNVGEYLYVHFPPFWRWTEEIKIKRDYTPGLALIDWLKEFKPEKDLLDEYGIFVPKGYERDWERIKTAWQERHPLIVERKDIASGATIKIKDMEIDLREFEARLTAAVWFLNATTKQELDTIFGLKPATSIKQIVAHVRYLWDTKQVSYLDAEMVYDLWWATEVPLDLHLLPKFLSLKLDQVLASIAPQKMIVSIFIGQLLASKSKDKMFRFRSALDQKQWAILSAMILVRRSYKDIYGIIDEKGFTHLNHQQRKARQAMLKKMGFGDILFVNFGPNTPLTLEKVRKFMSLAGTNVSISDLNSWLNAQGVSRENWEIRDKAMSVVERTPGGIDFNSANFDLKIKRDTNGVPWPLAHDVQLRNIEGLDPVILSIKPASQTSVFWQLQSSLVPQSLKGQT